MDSGHYDKLYVSVCMQIQYLFYLTLVGSKLCIATYSVIFMCGLNLFSIC